MKQVWVNAATAPAPRATTAGSEAPTLVTAMPEPRSMNELPSTSVMMPPSASATKTGTLEATPPATTALRRAASSADLGPGKPADTRASVRAGTGSSEWSWGAFRVGVVMPPAVGTPGARCGSRGPLVEEVGQPSNSACQGKPCSTARLRFPAECCLWRPAQPICHPAVQLARAGDGGALRHIGRRAPPGSRGRLEFRRVLRRHRAVVLGVAVEV